MIKNMLQMWIFNLFMLTWNNLRFYLYNKDINYQIPNQVFKLWGLDCLQAKPRNLTINIIHNGLFTWVQIWLKFGDVEWIWVTIM
jgi:hypothetical protein